MFQFFSKLTIKLHSITLFHFNQAGGCVFISYYSVKLYSPMTNEIAHFYVCINNLDTFQNYLKNTHYFLISIFSHYSKREYGVSVSGWIKRNNMIVTYSNTHITSSCPLCKNKIRASKRALCIKGTFHFI